MSTSLDILKKLTTIVADSGDFNTIKEFKPQDATTNPSLILAAAQDPSYSPLVDAAVEYGKKHGSTADEQVDATLDRLLVEFGREILNIVPGKVSTEVDAAFSYDTQKSVNKALHIIELYKELGIDKSRILIKIASTFEGIQAAKILQSEHGINCNLTLMFSLEQAIAAAEAGAFLISPFVGRILDYYVAKGAKFDKDPGVESVEEIYNYYKKFGYKTIVMGASFRNTGEIKDLAGCDYLTISPKLLKELAASTEDVPQKLNAANASSLNLEKKTYIDDKAAFDRDFAKNDMATTKLTQGIEGFSKDALKLKDILKAKIQGKETGVPAA